MKGKRILWPERGQVILDEVEVSPPGEGQVLIRTEVTLISPGTERAFLLGLPNTSGRYPVTTGYNNVGEVVEVGPGAQELQPGDRVVSAGNHAEYVTTAADRAIKVPESLESKEAVFFNMLCICLGAVRKAQIELGDSTLVIGQGLIGNLALQLAKLHGAFPVVGMDTDEGRLALAKTCGADEVLNAMDRELEEKLRAMTDGKGPKIVIEATGHPDPINTAFQVVARFGRVSLLASTRGETPKVNFYRDVHKKGITIVGAHNGMRPSQDSTPHFWSWLDDCKLVLKLLAAGRLHITSLITDEYQAEEAPEAYRRLMEWDPRLVGALLHWKCEE